MISRFDLFHVKGRRSNRDPGERPWTGMETLEGRLLLSGNVMAYVSNGTLVIKGDDAGDAIVLDQSGLSAGQARISSGDGATTINGGAGPVVFDYTNGISMVFGAGDDSVTLNGLTVDGNVRIDGGGGTNSVESTGGAITGYMANLNDQNVTLTDTSVTGRFGVSLSTGTSDVSISGGTFGEQVVVRYTGSNAGANSLDISSANIAVAATAYYASGSSDTTVEDSTIGGLLKVSTAIGYGACSFVVDSSTIDGATQAYINSGTVQLTNSTFGPDGGMAGNCFFLRNNLDLSLTVQGSTFNGSINAQYDDGTGTLNLSDVNVTGAMAVGAEEYTDPFNSNMTFADVTVDGNTGIVGDGGSDVIQIDNSDFGGATYIKTYNGDNTVQIATQATSGDATVFEGPTSIKLGGGNDTLQIGINGGQAYNSTSLRTPPTQRRQRGQYSLQCRRKRL